MFGVGATVGTGTSFVLSVAVPGAGPSVIISFSLYVLVAIAALGTQPWQEFENQEEAGLATILDNVTGSTWASTILAAGAVISIFSVTLVVMYRQTRILFAMGTRWPTALRGSPRSTRKR
jgi:amino acid transporter